jgi:hypothetical protein
METKFFQPPALWPFEPGHAVYYCPHLDRSSDPPACIPAVVLSIRRSKVSIRRADKDRATGVHADNLAFRGYCPHCPAPAIVGPDGQLICSKCRAPVVCTPLPDDLTLRWFPLDGYDTQIFLRLAAEHPDWRFQAVWYSSAAVLRDAETAMLKRLGLSKILSGPDTRLWAEEGRLNKLMRLYAGLGDADAFQATYDELAALLGRRPTPLLASHPLIVDWDDSYLLNLMDRSEEEEKHTFFRPPGDDQPDPDHSTAIDAWLDAQFRRAA